MSKRFSKLHPDIPAQLRGTTYAGLAHPAAIAHFKLVPGITITVRSFSVQYGVDEAALVDRGQTNYWGYNTLGFLPRFTFKHEP
jgi:glycogen operon protein